MKKTVIILAFIFGILTPVYAGDDFYDMSIEEYSKYFELGLTDEDDAEHHDEFEAKKPVLKSKANDSEVIKSEIKPIELKIERKAEVAPYRETKPSESSRNELVKTEKLTIFSDTKSELSDYMTNNIKSSVNASYKVNKAVDFKMGQEVWYVNPDASLGARKLYINPRLNLSKTVYMDFTGKYDERSKDIEQEIGINYKPKVFKDNASFGIKAGSKTNEQKDIQSGKLKFTTDWYVF